MDKILGFSPVKQQSNGADGTDEGGRSRVALAHGVCMKEERSDERGLSTVRVKLMTMTTWGESKMGSQGFEVESGDVDIDKQTRYLKVQFSKGADGPKNKAVATLLDGKKITKDKKCNLREMEVGGME